MSATPLLYRPLDDGARVVTDVVLEGRSTRQQFEKLRAIHDAYGDAGCDLIVVAVPAGEGVIVEHFLRKTLNVRSEP